MTKHGMIAKRSLALALAGAMVCGCAMGAGAASNPAVERDETVFVTLGSDGSVQKTTDSVWLHADGGLDGYTEDSGLSDITMLKDTEQPAQDGSRLTFSTADTDAYYQGTAEESLPISAEITYTLDGTEMTAEELAGQSGHLVMHIALTNNSYQMKTVGGQSRRICTPFVTVVAMTLDTDTFAAVQAENGTVQTDSSKDLVAYVCLPGMQECFDGLLNGDLSELGDKLTDDVTLEADVTNFEMPMLYIAASTDASDFSKEDELSDFDDLFDELDGMDDKLDDMMDGVQQLLDGSNELNNGANDLYTAVNTLNDGAATLQTGAHSAADGAATLSGGLNTLSGNSEGLRSAAQAVLDSTAQSVDQQLTAALQSDPGLTSDNFEQVLNGLLTQYGESSIFDQVFNGIVASKKDTSTPGSYCSCAYGDMMYGALMQNATVQALIADNQLTAEMLVTAINYYLANNGTVPTGMEALLPLLQAGDTGVQNGIKAAMGDPSDGTGAYALLQSKLQLASGATAQFQTALSSLSSLKAFRDGINSYTAGVDSAASGAGTLKTGLDTLASGTDTLRDGTGKLLDGVNTLKTGTGTLVDGVQELYDGVDEAYDKLQNNTGDFSLDDLQDIKDTLEEVKAQRESYSSFAGSADNTTGSVKFVMKVSAQKQQETEAAAAPAPDAPAENGNFFSNLWKRITALFHA